MAGGLELKIIAVTASAMDENRQDLLAIGADDFLSKPFSPPQLVRQVQELLDGRAAQQVESNEA